jgi:hypothetical protein
MYRMLMIGFGAGLITLGFVGIALCNYVEVERREDLVLVFQRAGASVANFSLNLSSGRYMLGVSVWVHNYAEGYYSISDVNGSQVVIVRLANTDQSSEWKYNEGYFQVIDSGYYTFELFNATFSSVRSTAQLLQRICVDKFLYPYRSLFWVGVFFLVVGVPLVVVGSATSLTSKP